MVGGDDQDRVVPVAVGFDPADDSPYGFLAAEDGADGVVEIVGVEGEIDVAGLDEKGEGLFGRAVRTVRAASVIWARVGCSIRSAAVYVSAARDCPAL